MKLFALAALLAVTRADEGESAETEEVDRPTPILENTWENGPTYKIFSSSTFNDKFELEVYVPMGQWLRLDYGTAGNAVDAVVFQGKGDCDMDDLHF